jgi:acetoin utilization deacetylase AcuC-like enzyme
MLIFSDAATTAHDPPFEIIDGRAVPYFEQPARVDAILQALAARGFAAPQAAAAATAEAAAAVHQRDYLDYLVRAAADWQAAGLTLPVLPSGWQRAAAAGRCRAPAGQAARWLGDLSVPITAQTYRAALSSAGLALAGAAALTAGHEAAYALCRPPGHHAGSARAAGYCFLNNAALAAATLSRGDGAGWSLAAPTTAILDLDYHHGDGTQEIFAERSDVLFVSLHADPAGEYPYHSGYADEIGERAGSGYTYNLPLAAGCNDAGYLAALDSALDVIVGFAPRFLVVSLGVDTAAGDPLGGFTLSRSGFTQIGQRIAALRLPTLFVQEGGYQVPLIGTLVTDVLDGFRRARGGSDG